MEELPSWFTYLVAIVFGLVVGSFLNVVIARVPERRSIVRPPSACPSCGAEIRSVDNIPVISWLLLRGKCHNCGAPISIQYPLVELGNALLWVTAVARFGVSWELPLALVLASCLLALSVIDAQIKKLPDPINLFAIVVGVVLCVVASAATGDWNQLRDAAIGSVACFGAFWLIAVGGSALLRKPAMGFGDVKLAGVLGLYLGYFGPPVLVIGLFFAFLTGAVAGVTLIALKKGSLQSAIPFGVFLAIGAWLGVLFAEPIWDWYRVGAGL